MKGISKSTLTKFGIYLLIIFLVVLFFFPVAWIFLTSIKTTGEIYAWPPVFIPKQPP